MGYQHTLTYLPRNLKKLRLKQGLTQQELAERLHYAHGSTIANFEDERQPDHKPKAAVLADLTEELQCGCNCLLYGDIVTKKINVRTRLLSEAVYLQMIPDNKAAAKAYQYILKQCESPQVIELVRISDVFWRTALDYHQCCPAQTVDRILLNMLRSADRLQYDMIIGKPFHDARLAELSADEQLTLGMHIPYHTYAPDDSEVEI